LRRVRSKLPAASVSGEDDVLSDRVTDRESALVLFSGGQDSTTCVVWALAQFARVETVGFDYGQRHATELVARQRILSRLRCDFPRWQFALGADHVLPMDVLPAIGGSALLAVSDMKEFDTLPNGLPASFVPGRNVLFLAAAAALAYRRRIWNLVGGMCETDFSGYPDCREDSITAIGRAIDLGMDAQFIIHTPLMHIDKNATWSLAEALGGKRLIDLIIEETVTCYEGDRETRHAWGYGCGECPACRLRAKGYERYVMR
jgi:7-cyano-7-deazaguanine synthase